MPQQEVFERLGSRGALGACDDLQTTCLVDLISPPHETVGEEAPRLPIFVALHEQIAEPAISCVAQVALDLVLLRLVCPRSRLTRTGCAPCFGFDQNSSFLRDHVYRARIERVLQIESASAERFQRVVERIPNVVLPLSSRQGGKRRIESRTRIERRTLGGAERHERKPGGLPSADGVWYGASRRLPCRSRLNAPFRWPLAAGRWPLAAGRWPLAAGRWPLAAGRWPLAAGRWPLAAGRWPLAERVQRITRSCHVREGRPRWASVG